MNESQKKGVRAQALHVFDVRAQALEEEASAHRMDALRLEDAR